MTHEVLRLDDEGGMLWRVSVAEIAADGPFSEFPGVDRIIALLEGQGCRLAIAGHPVVELTRPLASYRFAGETPITCSLVDGPVRDFNVMTRRGAARAALSRRGAGDATLEPTAAPDLRLLFVVAGALEATLSGTSTPLALHDALLCAGGTPLDLGGAGDCLEIAFWHTARATPRRR